MPALLIICAAALLSCQVWCVVGTLRHTRATHAELVRLHVQAHELLSEMARRAL